MIRDGLRRLAHEALRRIEEERDASQVQVFTAPWVLPGPPTPIRDGAVVMDSDGRVLECGPREDILPRFRWAHRAELDGILMPGFVDARAQLELGEVRQTLPQGLGLSRKLKALREVRKATEQLDPDSREAHIRAAVRRSVDAGTAAVGDVTSSLRPVPAMAREGLYGVVFHEIEAFSKRKAAKALAAAAVQRAGIVPWPEGIQYRLAPHSLYSTAGPVVADLVARALKLGVVTAIRLAEGEEELDLFGAGGHAASALLDAVGRVWDEHLASTDPVAYLDQLGALTQQVMRVHMTAATRGMARRASRAGAPLVLTPRADLQVGERLPPLVSFLEEGCRIALGTDSPASSPEQSVLREAAELHAAFPEVPSLVGSLEPGRSPGLLLADTDGHTPDDPAGWLLEQAEARLHWLARPAPPASLAA
jgi:cytosine/adenosine deaminase-related metal-dependent hydrolase